MDVVTATRGRWVLRALVAVTALAGCANHLGTTASSFMSVVREDTDPNRRYQAYVKLANPRCFDDEAQKAEAVALLAERMSRADEPVASRAVICRTLGRIGHPAGVETLTRALDDEEPIVRAEASRALGALGRGSDAIHLTRVMTADSDAECRLAAIDGLGAMHDPDPRSLLLLVEGMEDDDPAVRLASLRALRSISGEDLGAEPAPWREFARSRVAGLAPEDPSILPAAAPAGR